MCPLGLELPAAFFVGVSICFLLHAEVRAQDDRVSLAKAALLACQENLDSFPTYMCRFAHTKANAGSLEGALGGERTDARTCDYQMIVDRGKETFRSFAPTQLSRPKSVERDSKTGLAMYSVDFIPGACMKHNDLGLRYVPSLTNASVLGPDDEKMTLAPLPLMLGGMGRRDGLLGPRWLIQHCEKGEHVLKADGIVTFHQQPVIHAQCLSKSFDIEYYMDMQQAYLPVRIIEQFAAPDGRMQPPSHTYVLAAKACKKNRWFPTHVLRVYSGKHRKDPVELDEIRVTELDVDHTPSDEDFAVEIAPNTMIKWYNQVGGPPEFFYLKQKEKVKPDDIPRLAQMLKDSRKIERMDTAVQLPPSRKLQWFAVGSGAVLLLGSIALYLRRRRARAA